MITGTLVWYRGSRGFYAEKHPLSYEPPKDTPLPVDVYHLSETEYAAPLLILEQRCPVRAKLEDEPRVKLEVGK